MLHVRHGPRRRLHRLRWSGLIENPFDEVRAAVARARDQLDAADSASTAMARLLVGRMHLVYDQEALIKIKNELQRFDGRTKEWKALK